MVWGKAGSDTLTSAGDVLTVSDMTASKFNVILRHAVTTGNVDKFMTFNSDTGSKYAERTQFNGGTDATAVSQVRINNSCQPLDEFAVGYMLNISGEEKVGMIWSQGSSATGAGTAPSRKELVFKYVPSPDADITIITDTKGDSGQFDTNANLSMLGSDMTPAAATPFAENAQVGSRAEITDTRKMYHYNDPITLDDNFSDNLGWVKTGTKQDITGGKLTFTATRETTIQEESYNLGSALSTTWVCDFDLDITTFTSGGASTGAVWFGLSSVDGTTSGSEEVGDYMGLGLYIGTNTDIVVFNTNGNAWNTTSANICAGCGATDLFYVRMIRDGDTITINFYPTDTDRTAGTNSEKSGTKTTSGVTGLQYFRVGGRTVSGSFSATLLGSIDELKIWDGVTVVPTGNVWTEEGT